MKGFDNIWQRWFRDGILDPKAHFATLASLRHVTSWIRHFGKTKLHYANKGGWTRLLQVSLFWQIDVFFDERNVFWRSEAFLAKWRFLESDVFCQSNAFLTKWRFFWRNDAISGPKRVNFVPIDVSKWRYPCHSEESRWGPSFRIFIPQCRVFFRLWCPDKATFV